MTHGIDLTVIWAGIIALAVFAYVAMDGFDLGIGILFPLFPVGAGRNRAMNSIAPVWDGNETWLVLGGGGLFAAFPLAYAILLPAAYPLVIAMLLGLVFRGVAFEFRWRDPAHRPVWDAAFSLGSLTAALSQGIFLGAILQGMKVKDGAYAGGWIDWLTPFSLLTGIALVIGYALLGACWLVWKLTGEAQERAQRVGVWLALATLLALAAVSAATPFLHIEYWRRWFAFPNILFAAQIPILVAVVGAGLIASLMLGAERLPFLLSLVLFLLAYAGLAVSLYPYVVPNTVTIWDAAAPAASQAFMLAGVAVILPLILAYTAWAYWVFRGKVDEHGYH